MKYCSKCGNQMQDEAMFCAACGCKAEGNVQTMPARDELPVKKKKTGKLWKVLLIVVAVIILAVLIGAIVFLTARAKKAGEYATYIEEAESYAEEGEFDRAVKELKKAIKLSEKDEVAYLLLSDIYEEMGEYDKATDILEEGYEKTDSPKIKKAIKKMQENRDEEPVLPGESVAETAPAEERTEEAVAEEIPAETGTGESEETPQRIMEEEILDLYDDFLKGNTSACVSNDVTGTFEGYMDANNRVAMQDILEMLKAEYLDYSGSDEKLSSIQYSVIDCGKDGVPDLALRFVGLDYYCDDDDSNMTFAIRYEDGELSVCYAGFHYARGILELYHYGLAEYLGSGGAGALYDSYSLIGEDGRCEEVYSASHNYGMWAGEIDYDAYEECFDYEQENDELCIATYYIGDGVFHTYEIDYDYEEECLNFIQLLEEKGIVFCSKEDIDLLIMSNMLDNGMKEECMEKREIDWLTLHESFYSEYVGE